MPASDRTETMSVYQSLLANPLDLLRQKPLTVNHLPGGAETATCNLFFAAGRDGIAIDSVQDVAAGLAGAHQDGAVRRWMVASAMRGSALAPGVRLQPPVRAVPLADLWITEMQTGCSVLILDWGTSQISMVHLQPSTDEQFNGIGRAIMRMGDGIRSACKNLSLQKELTTIVQNTGMTPRQYILIQSMHAMSRGRTTQVIGVRGRGTFQFYRQTQSRRIDRVEHLAWSGWHSYVPYKPY